MQTLPRVYLQGNETVADLRAQGIPRSTAQDAIKRGWYCPGYHTRSYPQDPGPGLFAQLRNPYAFANYLVKRTLDRHGIQLDHETFSEWVQDALLECWRRRHAPHVTKSIPYLMAMIDGLTTDRLKRQARREERELYLEDLHVPLCA